MLGLLAAMLGGFAFYSGSKYFPAEYSRLKGGFPVRNSGPDQGSAVKYPLKGRLPAWSGVVFLLLSQVIYVVQMGLVAGLLAGFLAFTLAYSLLVFASHLPRKYFRLFWGVMVIFLILDLVF